MKNRTENISVRYRPQHLTKSHKINPTQYYCVGFYFLCRKIGQNRY